MPVRLAARRAGCCSMADVIAHRLLNVFFSAQNESHGTQACQAAAKDSTAAKSRQAASEPRHDSADQMPDSTAAALTWRFDRQRAPAPAIAACPWRGAIQAAGVALQRRHMPRSLVVVVRVQTAKLTTADMQLACLACMLSAWCSSCFQAACQGQISRQGRHAKRVCNVAHIRWVDAAEGK